MDDGLTADWLRDNGITKWEFQKYHAILLQAQKHAHTIINQHSELINPQQLQAIQKFSKLMRSKKSHQTVKPEAAKSTLNISSKVNRQLFRQRRQKKQAAPH